MRQQYIVVNTEEQAVYFKDTNFRRLQKVIRALNKGLSPKPYKVIMLQNYKTVTRNALTNYQT